MAITYIGGGGEAGWTGLALSDLDMNNFSIVNVNTITILQTATTGQALDVSRNLAAASTDSSIVCFYNLNAGDDQSVLTVRSAANAASANPMVIFETTDAAFDQVLLHGIQDGTGGGILIDITAVAGGKALEIDQDADAYGIEIQSAATTNTQYGLQVVTGAGATAANIQYSGSEFARLGMNNDANGSFWFYRSLAAASTAGYVVKIQQSAATDDQGGLYVVGANDATATNALVKFETTNAAHGSYLLYGIHDGTNIAFRLDNFGNERAMNIIHTDTGANPTFKIVRTGNNASDIWAIEIDCDNTGAGAPFGIDMTSFTAGEALLGVPVDTGAMGAHYGRYAVDVLGVGIKYVELLEAG